MNLRRKSGPVQVLDSPVQPRRDLNIYDFQHVSQCEVGPEQVVWITFL